MELIIKTYGRFLLEALVFVGFWILVLAGIRDAQGNKGFFQMLGSYFTEEQVAYGADFSVCVEESKRSAPEIFYKKKDALDTGVYNVTDLVGAIDCEGKELSVQVQEIWNAQGTVDRSIYDEAAMQIAFGKSGIYTMQVSATDYWNGMSTCRICIPVN